MRQSSMVLTYPLAGRARPLFPLLAYPSHACAPVPDRLLAKRWPWLLAAGVLIAVVLATLRVHTPGDWDTRPLGTVQDIAKLRGSSVNSVDTVMSRLKHKIHALTGVKV